MSRERVRLRWRAAEIGADRSLRIPASEAETDGGGGRVAPRTPKPNAIDFERLCFRYPSYPLRAKSLNRFRRRPRLLGEQGGGAGRRHEVHWMASSFARQSSGMPICCSR